MATVTDTRARILESAWHLAGERGVSAVTMADVAAASGVSRQLLYVHFQNRSGLLVAMARHHDHRSGFRKRVGATRGLPPVPALEQLIREWLAYIPELYPVANALEAAVMTGDDGGVVWRDRMEDLREAFRHAVRRVARDGRLGRGWSVETAADWVWARCHFSTWRNLVEERGWAPAEYVQHTVRSIMAEVVADGAGP